MPPFPYKNECWRNKMQRCLGTLMQFLHFTVFVFCVCIFDLSNFGNKEDKGRIHAFPLFMMFVCGHSCSHSVRNSIFYYFHRDTQLWLCCVPSPLSCDMLCLLLDSSVLSCFFENFRHYFLHLPLYVSFFIILRDIRQEKLSLLSPY